MAVQLTAYLAFRSETREALGFYAEVLGGTPTFSTYGEFGVGTPAEADKVMHGQLVTPDGITLMAADRPDEVPLESENAISLSLSGAADDGDRLRAAFDALSADGQVHEPLAAAPWGDWFGMTDDRYGLHWMVNIAGAAA